MQQEERKDLAALVAVDGSVAAVAHTHVFGCTFFALTKLVLACRRKCLQVLQYMLRVVPLDRRPAAADTGLLPMLR